MQQEYFNQLKELLVKLKDNQGHFIIQDGYFDAERNRGNEVFCQLMKNSKDDLIRFEALSHHFEKSLNISLKSKFTALGFTLEKDENYAKNILLNSDKDFDNTALEVVQIFEEIYSVNEQSVYDFDDQIEAVPPKPKKRKIASNSVVNETVQKPTAPKLSGCAWIIIISLAIVGYVTFFGEDSKKSSTPKETVFNSKWDASVQQVEDYLKNKYLNDPDSYKAISWSEVFKLNDTKEIGFPCYQVRHKYRAKNAFGGYVTEEKLFKLDYQGNIVDVRDYMR